MHSILGLPPDWYKKYRHAIERMEPCHYLGAGYYERTLTSLATLCVEKSIVAHEELSAAGGALPLAGPSAPGRGNAPQRERFSPGDRVRVRLDFVPGHPNRMGGTSRVICHGSFRPIAAQMERAPTGFAR